MAVLERLSCTKIEKIILRGIKRASRFFSLVQPGDRIIIACSGGADSFTLTRLFPLAFRGWNEANVEFIPVHIDGGEPYEKERLESIAEFSKRYGLEIRIVKADIYSKAFSESNPFSPCFTCSRLRKKALLEEAQRLKVNKIALAHHFDDLIETFLLNIFFSREISTMMPNQPLFDGKYHIIRPLVFISETYLKRYAYLHSFPISPYRCPFASLSKRRFVKVLLKALEKKFPGIKKNLYLSLYNVKLDYLLAKYSSRIDVDKQLEF